MNTALLWGDDPNPRATTPVIITRARRQWHIAHEHAAPPVRYRAAHLCACVEEQLRRERQPAALPPPRTPLPVQSVAPPPQSTPIPRVREMPDARRFLYAAWLTAAAFVVMWASSH